MKLLEGVGVAMVVILVGVGIEMIELIWMWKIVEKFSEVMQWVCLMERRKPGGEQSSGLRLLP